MENNELNDEYSNSGEQPAASQVIDSPTEKMIPQSEVGRIVNAERQRAYERAKDDMAKQQSQVANNVQGEQPASQQTQANPQDNEDKMRSVAQDVYHKAAETYAQQEQQRQAYETAHKIAKDLEAKSESVKEQYPDFDESLRAVGHFEHAPEVLRHAHKYDNAGDILYDLSKNPTKVANIITLDGRDPRLAAQAMSKLSDSITMNHKAKNAQSATAPLNSLEPSNIGMDNGEFGFKEYKKLYRG